MKTVIIGRGAVGSNVAYNLHKCGEVSFAVDKERAFRTKSYLSFNGSPLPVPTLVAGEDRKEAELIIVAVKNYQLESALPVISSFLGPSTTILPILNGIEAENTLSLHFGKERVLYGFISGLSVVRKGNEISSFSNGRITMGEKDNSLSERVLGIRDFFLRNGQSVVVAEDIHHEKWLKFMTNTCFNSLTALLEADYEASSNNTSMIRVARMMAKEVQSVAAKRGVVLTQDDVEKMIRNTCSLGGKGRSSMYEDIAEGRETENRYFAGAVSRLGREYSIPTPLCEMISILLEAKKYVVSFH